ncbi:MAG: methylenetetrahydrofolate reductase [Candidatus Pacebacteria bacterium]|nr:methylenetetrahydrofolate reductase [Candidatus Paceibacterota bacterium]
MHVSVELVPDIAKLESQLRFLRTQCPQVGAINIPDLPRFSFRSWSACEVVYPQFPYCIPHLRAIDCSAGEALLFKEVVSRLRFPAVLVVSGDPPTSMRETVHATSIFDLLLRIREELPQVKIYAALDQYRQSISSEIAYVERKLVAGFDGFFTQPFFSLHLLREWQSYMRGSVVYWGLSPVLSERSHGYWAQKNKVRFPYHFKPTLEWNVGYGRDFLDVAGEDGGNCYIMPIRVQIEEYCSALFA